MKRTRRLLLWLVILLLAIPAFSLAEDTTAIAEGAIPCEYTVPEEVKTYVSHLYDGDPFTTVTLRLNEFIEMDVPDGATTLFFHFYEVKQKYTLVLFDAEGKAVDRINGTSACGYLRVPVDKNTAKARLTSGAQFLTLCEWYAVSDESLLPFPDTDNQADVLVILNQPGDELTKLGGVLPMLCGEHGLSARVVYLTAVDGYRSTQCLEVLQKMGVRIAPYFGKGRNVSVQGEKTAINALGGSKEALEKLLVTEICTYRPQIVITLDPSKEQESYLNGFIGRSVLKAAEKAADPDSYRDMEPFEVSKIYTLAEEGKTEISGSQPLYAYDGATVAGLADELYKNYREERVFRRDMPDTVRFTLEESKVGEDQSGTDLLENLSLDTFAGYRDLTPTPEPTAEPTPEPTEEPTEEPTAEPAPDVTPAPTEKPVEAEEHTEEPTAPETPSAFPIWWIPAAIGLAVAVALWFLIPKHAKARILLCIVALVLGILLSIFLLIDSRREGAKSTGIVEATEAATPKPTEEPTPESIGILTPEPTEEPTPEPTEEPTPEPTEAPTPEPTPDPDDAYFLSGEGEEYELDFENGHWWYKNNVLSIDVKEIHSEFVDANNKTVPMIYYVADIRMREYTSYRSGVRDFIEPYKYARLENAVLAVTGDNLNMQEKEEKGCLIRKGVFYCNANHDDTLVIHEDMTLSVIHRGNASERVLMDYGIRDTYGFGPILVENGQVNTSIRSRVDHPNPRCGIGMVEPGHWIVIATEGRQQNYAHSVSLPYLAQMFVDYGCTVACNLDGGSSVGVVFMGQALNRHYKRGSSDTQRPWYDAIMFGYSADLPDVKEPTIHDGLRHDVK